jgi:hypothetical protein
MCSSVSSEIRRNHTVDILHAYYDTLCANFTPVPFSFDDVKTAYEQSFRVSVCMLLPMFPAAIKMVKAGVLKLGDMDPKLIADIFIDNFKGLTEETVRYVDKYGSADSK